jgi:23S rRNA (adenine2030-N6)-methyltransferase
VNYQHTFHAGNFADLAKHLALVYCLEALKRKQTPFFVLDSHAGRGQYDLLSDAARRSGEAADGVFKLLRAKPWPEELLPYLTAIGAPQDTAHYQHYPGSAALIARALRHSDRAVFVEQSPPEARALAREVSSAGRVRTDIDDGYIALKALLPPAERRGLVFIDPPYEDSQEFALVCTALADAYRRWPTGQFMIWYPIRDARQRAALHAKFAALGIAKMLSADFAVHSDDAPVGLAGGGLVIINAPFGCDDHLRHAYTTLHRILAQDGQGYVDIARLTPERIAR